ncbi:Cytidine and deoxycytidylate deaminase zinc-binding region [compost metagenome]
MGMSKDQKLAVFINFTKSLAGLSKCCERGVAAIIADADFSQVHSIGINGGPKNLVDCMCKIDTKYGCVHAEINCLIKNSYTGADKVMITTLAPCNVCAAAIINAPGGFKTVYYMTDWKEDTGTTLLRHAGIQVIKV